MQNFLKEFFLFALKMTRSCIFPFLFIGILSLSRIIVLPGLPRYDFIFLATVFLQILLLIFKVESIQEVLVLSLFHGLGLALELFKTHPSIGSWSYPEAGFLKIGGVPLYSGFMYAAVASFMCQAWRICHLELTHYPPYWISLPLSLAIYLNFFTHHFIGDARWILAAGVVLIFWRTTVHFRVMEKTRAMPMVLTFFLIGLFVWIAENLATYLGAWVYPNQKQAWELVSAGKISSWSLLVIISFIIVADLKHIRKDKLPGLESS